MRSFVFLFAWLVGLLAYSGTASAKIYVYPKAARTSYGYQIAKYKPRQLQLSPSLGRSGLVYDIHWRGWGTARAVGIGKIFGIPPELPSRTRRAILVARSPLLETVCRAEHHPFTYYYYRQLRVLAAPNTPGLGNIAAKPTIQC